MITRGSFDIRLGDLAFPRSGDKGNSCNIGVIARDPAYLPYIREQITEEAVKECFQHVFEVTIAAPIVTLVMMFLFRQPALLFVGMTFPVFTLSTLYLKPL